MSGCAFSPSEIVFEDAVPVCPLFVHYDRFMVRVHMTEAEIAGDFAAALEKVRQGLEVVVEHDHHAIAVLKPAEPPCRKISECIAMLPADSTAVIDPDFAADVEAAIEAHHEALEPPAWD